MTIEALKLFLKSLSPDAYFAIISFGSKHKFLQIGKKIILCGPSDLKEAMEQINEMEANMGGTEISRPLDAAIRLLSENEYVFGKKIKNSRIFLLTDGEVEDRNKVIEIAA